MLSLFEELLLIHGPLLQTASIDITLIYSEKKDRLELIFESFGERPNPLDKRLLPDELGLKIINSLAERIEYRSLEGKNRLTISLKKGPND